MSAAASEAKAGFSIISGEMTNTSKFVHIFVVGYNNFSKLITNTLPGNLA